MRSCIFRAAISLSTRDVAPPKSPSPGACGPSQDESCGALPARARRANREYARPHAAYRGSGLGIHSPDRTAPRLWCTRRSVHKSILTSRDRTLENPSRRDGHRSSRHQRRTQLRCSQVRSGWVLQRRNPQHHLRVARNVTVAARIRRPARTRPRMAIPARVGRERVHGGSSRSRVGRWGTIPLLRSSVKRKCCPTRTVVKVGQRLSGSFSVLLAALALQVVHRVDRHGVAALAVFHRLRRFASDTSSAASAVGSATF